MAKAAKSKETKNKEAKPKASKPKELTPIEKAHAAALQLPAADVPRASRKTKVFLGWLGKLAAYAKEDLAALLQVSMIPEENLTEEEVLSLEHLVALASKTRDELEVLRVQSIGSDALDALLQKAREAQATVLIGLRHLYRGDREMRKELSRIARGEGVADLFDDTLKLQAIAEKNSNFSKLTNGEPAALVVLKEVTEQLRAAKPEDKTQAPRALRDRVIALATLRARRVCAAGRYCFAKDPEKRAHYRVFQNARKAKKKAQETTAPKE